MRYPKSLHKNLMSCYSLRCVDAIIIKEIVDELLADQLQQIHLSCFPLLGLYSDVPRKISSNIREETINKNLVAPYCVHPRLKQDADSMFVSNYLVFSQAISQRAILITVLTSGGCFDTSQISKGSQKSCGSILCRP